MASTASNHVSCGYNGHYHLYMTITQNKRDASTNQSNVTVKMYAQSDSSSYGAYNLDASGNTVKMTVNSKQVINKTMAMDFRNKATVLLASWTGSHQSWIGRFEEIRLLRFIYDQLVHLICLAVLSVVASSSNLFQELRSQHYLIQLLL